MGAPGARSEASTHGPYVAVTAPRGRHDLSDNIAAVSNGTSGIGALRKRIVWDGTDTPLWMFDADRGVTVYFEQDTGGNVRRLHAGERITGGGAFTGDLGGYAYTAFGRPIAVAEPGGVAIPKIDGGDYFQRIQWQGRWLYNRSGGLYNFRARFWSPQLGAFLQLDQYQFLSSGGTLWSWPGQNPFRWRDPSGRSAAEAIAEGLELLEGLAPGVAANNNLAPVAGPAGGLAALAMQASLQLYWGQVQALGQDLFAQQDANANALARAAARARPAAGGGGKRPPDCPTGGRGPVDKGKEGVERAIREIEARGGRVLGREVSVQVNGVTTRPDLLAETAGGEMEFVEVKNGPYAGLTPNQVQGFPGIQSGGAVPIGANAAAAGLQPGLPLPPTPVRVIWY